VSDLNTIVQRHLGRPWNRNGFDCWQFVRSVYFEAYGVTLSNHGGIQLGDSNLRQVSDEMIRGVYSDGWMPVNTPQPGDLVLLGRREWPHHCGVWLEAGRIAHNLEEMGVAIHHISTLRASGWGFVQTYRHEGLLR
jgi:cell wall-associated NlpC family hydrolase